MRETTKRRVEKLEVQARINSKPLAVIIHFVGLDKNRKCYSAGGLLMIPGRPREKLSASHFKDEEFS